MAAPMTASEVLPAGISCAVTFWSECEEFHSFTIALPQAISSGLFDSHTLMGPVDLCASLEPEPPPHAAVRPSASTATDADRIFVLIRDLLLRGHRAVAVRNGTGRSSRAPRGAPPGGRPGWVVR